MQLLRASFAALVAVSVAVVACSNDDSAPSSAATPGSSAGSASASGTAAASASAAPSASASSSTADASDASCPPGTPEIDCPQPPPPCNDQNPAILTRYDRTRNCFEAAAPVPGVCLNNLDLTDIAGLATIECAFDSSGDVYARLALEGEWLTGEGWTFANLEPFGSWPLAEFPTAAQQAFCTELGACAADCATGQLLYADGFPPDSCGNFTPADAATDAH